MADFEGFTPLNMLNANRDDWKVRVKVYLLWNQTYKDNPSQVASMEMILIDQEGHKIQASVMKFLIPDFRDTIKEGSYYEISNFGLGPNKGNYLLVEHEWKINFLRITKARIWPSFEIATDGFNLVSFDDVLQWRVSRIFAFDLVGHLVEIKEIRINRESGKESKSIEFVLEDLDGNRINCALWGDNATKLVDYVTHNQKLGENIIVCINNAKVKEWKSNPQVSNQLFGCRIHINSDVPPIQSYKEGLQNKEDDHIPSRTLEELTPNTVVNDALDHYKKAPVLTIEKVRSTVKVSECVVKATVINVLLDEGWFTYACKTCGKKAQRKVVETDKTRLFDCNMCGPVTEVYGKVRTVVRVQDLTGSTSFILFDRQLSKLLNRSVAWINNKIMRIDDPHVLPDEVQKLVNMDLVFKVAVSDINLKYQYPAYTVLRATDDVNVVDYVITKLNDPQPEVDEDQYEDFTPVKKVYGKQPIEDTSPMSGSNITPIPFSLKRKSESPPEENNSAQCSSKTVDDINSLKISRMEDM